jgi:hypothetical protein
MAVFFEAAAPVGGSGASTFLPLLEYRFAWDHPGGTGSERAAVVPLTWTIGGDIDLDHLTRTVTFGGVAMESLGVAAWNDTEGAYTEMFGLLNPPAGKARVVADVLKTSVFAAPSWALRGHSLTYTGVASFGDAVTAYGSGTSLTISATATAAGMVVHAYGCAPSLSNYNQTQRVLSNSGWTALLSGDMQGTGSSEDLTATKSTSGAWAGVAVPLVAAPIVGSAKPVVNQFTSSAAAKRLPRPGINRRVVFDAQPED